MVAVVSIALFLSALWVFTPFYDPFFGPSFNQLGFVTAASAILMLCMSLPGLRAIKSGKSEHIAMGAFFLFLYYCFNAFVRMIITGFASISWVPLVVVALLMAIVYIEQSHVTKQRDA